MSNIEKMTINIGLEIDLDTGQGSVLITINNDTISITPKEAYNIAMALIECGTKVELNMQLYEKRVDVQSKIHTTEH